MYFIRKTNFITTDRYQSPDPSESFLALFTINLFFFFFIEELNFAYGTKRNETKRSMPRCLTEKKPVFACTHIHALQHYLPAANRCPFVPYSVS